MKFDIEKPCSESWDAMKIGVNSRFCENCNKDVIDFTNKNRQEIVDFIKSKGSDKVCGKVKYSQIDIFHKDFPISVDKSSRKKLNYNFAIFVLTTGVFVIPSPAFSQNTPLSQKQNCLIQNSKDSSNSESKTSKKDDIIIDDSDFEILGEIAFPDENINDIYTIVDTMPEFIGGFTALMKYVNSNIKYPCNETGKINGTVYVTFVIDTSGKVIEPKVIKGIDGHKELNDEAIRVIEDMPKWKPGKHNGETVKVQFHLPIKFKL